MVRVEMAPEDEGGEPLSSGSIVKKNEKSGGIPNAEALASGACKIVRWKKWGECHQMTPYRSQLGGEIRLHAILENEGIGTLRGAK